MTLPGAHRTRKEAGGVIYVRWTAWRGRGAPLIGSYKAATDAQLLELERADAAGLARRYAEARDGLRPSDTLGALLELYAASAEFKRCAVSTQTERARVLASMRGDIDARTGKAFVTLPAAALASKRTRAVFQRWRDTVAAQRGPRAADWRMETLKVALGWCVEMGHAQGNQALGISRLSNADRSELIWEAHHTGAFLAWIRAEIWRAWRETDPASPMRHARVARLAAARDAVLLAQSTGMRRENIARHKWAELQPPAIVYTALKGARRARTAGRKTKTTVLPILEQAARIYARRHEATGASSPWIITGRKGGPYSVNGLGATVYQATAAAGVPRTLHDCKGTFVTHLVALGVFSDGEIAGMVDWSVAEVEAIKRKYVSAPAIASALLERMKRKGGG